LRLTGGADLKAAHKCFGQDAEVVQLEFNPRALLNPGAMVEAVRLVTARMDGFLAA